MVVIKKRSNVIPVDFGDFQLEFRANDDAIQKMKTLGDKLQAKGQEVVDKVDREDSFEALHDLVKSSWVELFDESAFEKVYAFADKTTTDTMFYLIETIKGVVAEWEARNNESALKKYLE